MNNTRTTLLDIKELHRAHKDMQQARIRIELQMQAIHRRIRCRCPRDADGKYKHTAECTDHTNTGFNAEVQAAKRAEERQVARAGLASRKAEAEAEVARLQAAGKRVPAKVMRRSRGDDMPAGMVKTAARPDEPVTALAFARRVLEREEEVRAARLEDAVRRLPAWHAWGRHVRGVAELSFGQVLGELGRSPREYRSVAACWKRLGLAVVDGMAQGWVPKSNNKSGRGRASGDDAIRHGYSGRRRSVTYVVGINFRNCGAGGPYRTAYDEKKAQYLERGWSKGHADNAAMRFATKLFIRDLWVNWVDDSSSEQAA